MQAAEESGEFSYVAPLPVRHDDVDRPGVTSEMTASDDDGHASLSPAAVTDHVSQKMVRASNCFVKSLTSLLVFSASVLNASD